jgi:hypothetical protein
MIRRLLTLLLALCLATPAMAMPLAQISQRTDHAMHHDTGHGDHGDRHQPVNHDPASHQCVGCAALARQVTAPARTPELRGLVAERAAVRPLDGTGTPPAIPPPRA